MIILPSMLEIPPTPPLPTVPPAQDFSKLGFAYITVLGLANQVVPNTGNWQSLAISVNYLARITPIVYLAFQARPASPVGVKPDSGMGHDTRMQPGVQYFVVVLLHLDIINQIINKINGFREGIPESWASQGSGGQDDPLLADIA
ncbi:hypothetical protein DSO57_1016529 [Entomophthora muscae]|uniref:Uncharacterized protein n=1 Tax=Entomophthora muscae TaxID=34485 RepID=A0ACC2RJH4_9FUNG|nr:hypothetical protein DSO57_1016529 [Entomophthora muscae]